MIEIRPTLKIQRAPRGMAKAFIEARQEALVLIGKKWHKDFLPKHFTEGAYGRYKYALRKQRYEKRKMRKVGHRKPLVFSGVLEKQVKAAATISATSKSVRVRMSGPSWLAGYIAFKGRKGTGPDKKKEILTVIQTEGQELAKLMAEILKNKMNTTTANPASVKEVS